MQREPACHFFLNTTRDPGMTCPSLDGVCYMHARTILILLALAMSIPSLAKDGDWPRYRGVSGNGIANPADLLDQWPAEGPKEVWRQAIGPGYGEMIQVDGKIYTNSGDTEGEEKSEYLISFDAATGKELWRLKVDTLIETEFGNGSRSTPTVDGDMVYGVSGKGTLVAATTAGKEVWRVNFQEKYESPEPRWGFSGSVVVSGNLIYVNAGGKDGFLMAFDRKSGEQKWSSLEGNPGYSTPSLVNGPGDAHLVTSASGKLFGVKLSGEKLWELPFDRYSPIVNPLAVGKDRFFFSSNDVALAMMVRVSETDGAYKAEELWRTKRFKNHFSGSINWQDRFLIGFDAATLKCISVEDGKMVWGKRGYGKGSLIMCGDKLFILSDRGKLIMARAHEDRYEELATVQAIKGRSWTAPVMVGSRIYLRNMTEMVCYDLAK